MGRYFWIIFLLLGIWQVIGSVVERATKKQHDQRVKDLASQRRRQEMVAQRTSGEQRVHRTTPSTGPVVLDRASELAARRKAQLDELRARRAARSGRPGAQPAPSSTVLRPSHPTARTPVTSQARTPVASQTGMPRPVPPTAAPAPTPPRRTPTPQTRQRPAVTSAARRIVPMERSAAGEHRLVPTRKADEVKGPRMLKLPGVGETAVDRNLLRRMMLYHEILEPPLALREHQPWER